MKKRSERLVPISFYVNDKLYKSKVFLNRPTAIVLPDQNFIAFTTIGTKSDSNSKKSRYSNVVEPDEKLEGKIERKQFKHRSRTIFKQKNELNELKIVKRSEDEPFTCNCRNVVLATRLLVNPR